MTSVKRFCVINCENSTVWSPYTFSDMFENGLRQDGDLWTNCEIANGAALPEDVLDYQGLIITGSHFNCRDKDALPWFDSVCDVIREAATRGTPRIYGGCFGCQIIAYALGGRVDYNPGGKFFLKAEFIRTTSEFSEVLQVDSDTAQEWGSKGANIIVSHGDCVLEIPPTGKLLGSSESCRNEIYVCGSKNNILACQSHPEFEYEYAVQQRIWPVVVEVRKRLDREDIEKAKATFENFEKSDSLKLMKLISSFLHADV